MAMKIVFFQHHNRKNNKTKIKISLNLAYLEIQFGEVALFLKIYLSMIANQMLVCSADLINHKFHMKLKAKCYYMVI